MVKKIVAGILILIGVIGLVNGSRDIVRGCSLRLDIPAAPASDTDWDRMIHASLILRATRLIVGGGIILGISSVMLIGGIMLVRRSIRSVPRACEASSSTTVKRCPVCGSSYRESDFAQAAKKIFCLACKSELPRGDTGASTSKIVDLNKIGGER